VKLAPIPRLLVLQQSAWSVGCSSQHASSPLARQWGETLSSGPGHDRIDPHMALLPELEAELGATSKGRTLLGDGFRSAIPADRADWLLAKTGATPSELRRWLASLASVFAVAGISGYRVGAVAEGIPSPGAPIGALYLGANMEFPGRSLALTLHAEQAAVVNAWHNDEPGAHALTVTAPPCGYCRQFLNELVTAERLQIEIASVGSASKKSYLLSALLPLGFGPKEVLGTVEEALMTIQRHRLRLRKPTNDFLVITALDAANRSHAPYSKAFAGVALQVSSGTVFQGRYAENAAFNPSLHPLAAALSMQNLSRSRGDRVTRCVLVQNDSTVDHRAITSSLLQTIADIDLEFWPAWIPSSSDTIPTSADGGAGI
jgi:cytidine deaminase